MTGGFCIRTMNKYGITMKQNNNRVALVTGANKGIGFEIARGLEDGPTEGFFSSAGRERW